MSSPFRPANHVTHSSPEQRPALARNGWLALGMAGGLLGAQIAHAATGESQSDFGGVGLMQTPTARFAPQGELSFTYSRTQPYKRFSVNAAPFDWMELGFRYVSVETVSYGAAAPDRDYLDKSFDTKFRLLQEGRYQPEVAVGLRDLGGTGLFSSEYLVASKRYGDLDFSLGLGWGYLGTRGDFSNPLAVVRSSLETRSDSTSDDGGDFQLGSMFSGSPAVFGGIEYQTPWDPLTLMLEYEGNDYSDEPLTVEIEQDSPVNLGATVKVNDNLSLHGGWERGNTAMLGLSLSTNLAGLAQAKDDGTPEAVAPSTHSRYRNDQTPEAFRVRSLNANASTASAAQPAGVAAEPSAHEEPSANREPSAYEERSAGKEPLAHGEPSANKDQQGRLLTLDSFGGAPADSPLEPGATDGPEAEDLPRLADVDWDALADTLRAQSGLEVSQLRVEGDTLIVEAEATRFRDDLQAEGRANRVLHNRLPAEITTFRYRLSSNGLALREDEHPRQPFVAAANDRRFGAEYEHSITAHAASPHSSDEETRQATGDGVKLAREPFGFSWGFSPSLKQNFGGPDGYLYQLNLQLDALWRTDRNGWFTGVATYQLADNFDSYEYIADSELPRVRTYVGEYIKETDLGITSLQYNRTHQFGRDWYAQAYGGILEMMYAGVGAELLYRPMNSSLALGLDINRVRQREFDQQFGLRDYSVTTGHATAYWQSGWHDVLVKGSVGRYLAGDVGATLDLSRSFSNGVSVGAWATLTDAGDDYGEGSFDKGLYVSIPLDAFFTTSSKGSTGFAWAPLTRDGGARLNRRYQLYDMTRDRDPETYWEGIDKVYK
ncbi:YjbH domain-containing protein [Cobetia sp. 1CM21F]|uniref:YjbH domain-containing protein n=1 Tax=Cobetia sp. 1CM21F TaxID=2929163 RepID=UPI0020BFCA32|nr:YjbH domain-containing protein [Cobetia sp. 1CM21F]MCK8066788.1 YjbH domain-containing protein [Cobetia sp. 1CM21F]